MYGENEDRILMRAGPKEPEEKSSLDGNNVKIGDIRERTHIQGLCHSQDQQTLL